MASTLQQPSTSIRKKVRQESGFAFRNHGRLKISQVRVALASGALSSWKDKSPSGKLGPFIGVKKTVLKRTLGFRRPGGALTTLSRVF